MEEMMDILFGLIVIVAAFAAKIGKQKATTNKSAVSHEAAGNAHQAPQAKPQIKAAAPAAAAKTIAKQPVKVEEVHFHEGRQDVPCPATEKRPGERRNEKPENTPAISGLNLSFDRNTVLQGFVMSEILNRPRSGMRR